MPVTFVLDHDRRIVRSRAWGVVTFDELNTHVGRMAELFESRTLDDTWSQVADFSDTEDLVISSEGVRRLGDRNPWPAGARRAFVAPRDLVYGFSRMYEMVRKERGDDLVVFRSMEAALEWIGEDRAGEGG